MKAGQKILIVDDVSANLVALEKVLSGLDVDIIKAANGNEALKAIINHDFALGILDVQMPEMDGYELADLIRGDEKNQNLPIIFLSAVHSDEFHIFKGYESGAVDFVTKPYDPFILLSKVKIFLRLDEQKKVLQENIEIEKSKNYLENILSSLEEGIIVTDLGFNITTVNKKILMLRGTDITEQAGKNPDEFFTVGLKEKWEEYLLSIENNNVKTSEFIFKTECELKRPEKDNMPVLLTVSGLNNRSGELLGTVWSVTDITERKKAELDLLASRERFSRAVMFAPFPIMIHNENSEIKLINEEWTNLSGYTNEDLPDLHSWLRQAYGRDEDFVLEDIKRIYRQEGKLDEGEYQIKTKNGELRTWYFSSTPLGPDENGVNTAISMALDITGLKEIEKELKLAKARAEEISRLKSNFLANMSHELRTPLMGILGYTEVLMSELESDEYVKMLKKIMFSGQRLSDTINSILDLTKVETDRITAEIKLADINFTVNPVIESFRGAMAEKRLDFQIVKHPGTLCSMTDENLLGQIIKHLLHNAAKYTHKGYVRLTTGREVIDDKKFVTISVADSGIGIPGDKIDLIWEEFRQVSEGISRNFEGCGLGLTIVKKLTNILGGTVTVESETGKGSVFTVLLPASDSAENGNAGDLTGINKEVVNSAEKNGLRKILYTEDDEINQEVINLFLRGKYEITVVKNSDETMSSLDKQNYDLLLVDINLGEGLSGVDLIKEIRKNKELQNIPAIAVTAYAAPGDKEAIIEAGFNAYIPKPFDRKTLLGNIRDLLDNRE
ncbi:MAG: response regulator [Ignavibacteriaceae bacterium]|nr:response regulator [Ignavibacteriaceae bacterium]